MFRKHLPLALVLAIALTGTAVAQEMTTYDVTITNVSRQIISPPILVTHNWMTNLFRAGKKASPEVAAVAEDADSAALIAGLEADPDVFDVAMGGMPLMPGASMVLEIEAQSRYDRLSAMGMLVTTNDAFFGLDNYRLEQQDGVASFGLPAYDAGSEANNESCDFIPGPPCGNPHQRDTAGAEGLITVHAGIHGVGDLDPASWTWLNPVVQMTIRPRS